MFAIATVLRRDHHREALDRVLAFGLASLVALARLAVHEGLGEQVIAGQCGTAVAAVVLGIDRQQQRVADPLRGHAVVPAVDAVGDVDDEVQVAAILKDGTVCDISDTELAE